VTDNTDLIAFAQGAAARTVKVEFNLNLGFKVGPHCDGVQLTTGDYGVI
jgi:hypothetical protein